MKCDMSAWQKVYYKQVTDMGRVGLQTGFVVYLMIFHVRKMNQKVVFYINVIIMCRIWEIKESAKSNDAIKKVL